MKTFYLVGDHPNLPILEKALKEHFKKSKRKPDFVVCVGGHGTLFEIEKEYSTIPKLFLRHPALNEEEIPRIVEKLKNKEFEIKEHPKLTASVGKNIITAMNDVVIHCKHPEAIRLQLFVNGKPLFVDESGKPKTIIGDGVVIASPYGSTGYFYSIARKIIKPGWIGIAINNPVENIEKSVFLPKNSVISVLIERGPGTMFHDSSKKAINLKTGSMIELKVGENARLIQLK